MNINQLEKEIKEDYRQSRKDYLHDPQSFMYQMLEGYLIYTKEYLDLIKNLCISNFKEASP